MTKSMLERWLMMEWEHYCDDMPEEIDGICKLNISKTSQITFTNYIKGVMGSSITLYGFEYCPYCGAKLGDTND